MPRLAVLGQPVGHSLSPVMQTAALAELGLAGEWTYEAIEVAPEEFEARVRAMPAEGFAGANVTVPHKLAALTVADRVSNTARRIGAANTLSFDGDEIVAENTDAAGLLGALGRSPAGLRALVLGAGGSARAVVWALVEHGAEVSIWNRTPERAVLLARELAATAVSSEDCEHRTGGFDLLVNTTTIGMPQASGKDLPALKELPIDADSLEARHLVVDLAYGAAETELVRIARERGAQAVDGLEVLVHQGAASLRIWTGQEPPIEAMRRAARSAHDT
jgi:shikimate dehydrogenase